jgi:hypothetical protein
MHPAFLDAACHQRQAVTLPGYHAGRPPRNNGRRYPRSFVVGSARRAPRSVERLRCR